MGDWHSQLSSGLVDPEKKQEKLGKKLPVWTCYLLNWLSLFHSVIYVTCPCQLVVGVLIFAWGPVYTSWLGEFIPLSQHNPLTVQSKTKSKPWKRKRTAANFMVFSFVCVALRKLKLYTQCEPQHAVSNEIRRALDTGVQIPCPHQPSSFSLILQPCSSPWKLVPDLVASNVEGKSVTSDEMENDLLHAVWITCLAVWLKKRWGNFPLVCSKFSFESLLGFWFWQFFSIWSKHFPDFFFLKDYQKNRASRTTEHTNHLAIYRFICLRGWALGCDLNGWVNGNLSTWVHGCNLSSDSGKEFCCMCWVFFNFGMILNCNFLNSWCLFELLKLFFWKKIYQIERHVAFWWELWKPNIPGLSWKQHKKGENLFFMKYICVLTHVGWTHLPMFPHLCCTVSGWLNWCCKSNNWPFHPPSLPSIA